jgi:hypothetical protein
MKNLILAALLLAANIVSAQLQLGEYTGLISGQYNTGKRLITTEALECSVLITELGIMVTTEAINTIAVPYKSSDIVKTESGYILSMGVYDKDEDCNIIITFFFDHTGKFYEFRKVCNAGGQARNWWVMITK